MEKTKMERRTLMNNNGKELSNLTEKYHSKSSEL